MAARSDQIDRVRALLDAAIDRKVFPAAVAEIGDSRGAIWREPFGGLTFDTTAPSARDETIFDLASLTKTLATTSLALDLANRGLLDLDERVSSAIPEWIGPDRSETTIRDLLEHASGLAARLIDLPPATRREFEHEIASMPLEYPRRSRSLYSDLDFILLGFIVADRGGLTLDRQFDALAARFAWPAGAGNYLGYGVPHALRQRTAPTLPLPEDARRGQQLAGDVHDNYANALGGVAGHAGLFGTAPAVGAVGRLVLRGARGDSGLAAPFDAATTQRTIQKSSVPGSSRALGWDTMLSTSSCGARLSRRAFGHTGFTGTSLWIDPEIDRYFVLLTNRVCGGGTSEEMQSVRRAFHDAAATV